MIVVPSNVRVHLALGTADMRKGLCGLSMLVQKVLNRDPFSGHMFVFRGKSAIALDVARAPADIDPGVATLSPPQLLQPLQKRRETGLPRRIVRRDAHQYADTPHAFRLLCPRRERPRGRRAPEKRDELAPVSHSIASSARASSAGGTVRSSALAVFRLITSTNLVAA